MSASPTLSVIIPILEFHEGFEALNARYLRALADARIRCEVIYVLDSQAPAAAAAVAKVLREVSYARSISLNREFGDSTALKVGVQLAAGDRMLVLPAHPQVVPEDVPKVVAALETCDLAIGERDRADEAALNRMHGWLFNGLLAMLVPSVVRDMGCEVLAFKRKVVEEVPFHGDQHRFLPILAHRVGFSVRSVKVAQTQEDRKRSFRRVSKYTGSLTDVLAVVFLTRFVKKPLRFFGLMGLLLSITGLAVISYVVFQRFALGVPLATRPMFVLGTLLVVTGIQLVGIGLIGEIVIFSRARDLPDYYISEVVESAAPEFAVTSTEVSNAARPAGIAQESTPVPEDAAGSRIGTRDRHRG